MKKFQHILWLGAVALSTAACAVKHPVAAQTPAVPATEKMLLGTQTKAAFTKAPYSEWYNPQHDSYQMDMAAIQQLKNNNLGSYDMVVTLGSWCEDSHREFPRMMKILEELNFPEKNLKIIAVNRQKVSPSKDEELYDIHRVPTFILKKGEKEIGRIVEFPQSGYLERDLLQILKKSNKN